MLKLNKSVIKGIQNNSDVDPIVIVVPLICSECGVAKKAMHIEQMWKYWSRGL